MKNCAIAEEKKRRPTLRRPVLEIRMWYLYGITVKIIPEVLLIPYGVIVSAVVTTSISEFVLRDTNTPVARCSEGGGALL